MIALLLAGCALGPGQAFGRIDAATLDAVFVPGAARDLGGGEVLTQEGYAVRVDRFAIELGDVALLAITGGGGGGGTFDPANPPEGYSLCHGGHCHAADGSLVDYADIQAAMSGGDAGGFSSVVTLPIADYAELVPGDTFDLDVSGWDLLPAAEVAKVEVGVIGLVIDGVVRRHPDDGWSAPLHVDLALDAALGAGFDLPFDRDHDPGVALAIAVEPDGTLFDGLDLAALAADGDIVLDDLDDEGAAALAAAVLATAPAVAVERTR